MNSAATTNIQPRPRPARNDDHVGGQDRGQQDAPHHGEPGQPEDAADLDDLAVDRDDRAHDAEIDREEHADRDQRDLRGLEDAEPEDEQRHPGDRGNGAQRLQGRVDQPAHQRRIAGDRAEHGAGDDAEGKSRDHPRERGAAWSSSSPVRARSAKVCTMTDGGGTRRPLARPCRTASSHATATATGSRSPSAGRNRRPGPPRATLAFDGAGVTSAGSTLAVIDTRDITGSRNATAAVIAGAGQARAPQSLSVSSSPPRSGRRSGHRPSSSRPRWPERRRPAARRGRPAGSSRAAPRRPCCA